MAKTKRFFWLRFKEDFFNQKEIKKLRRIAGGDTFTIIYLKMQLLSVKNEGLLTFDGTEENIAEQLSLEIDEDTDNIKITIEFLVSNNLIEKVSEENFLLNKVPPLIGKETDSAERMRRLRAKPEYESKKASLCSPDVRKSDTEIEIEIEKKKEIKKDIYTDVYTEIISYLNERTSSRYRNTESTKKLIRARIDEGFTKEDFFTVIDNKVKTWKGTEWEKYLRPQTLFNATKFQGYLNEKGYSKQQGNDISKELQAKGVFKIENGKYYTERGTEFDPFEDLGECPF